MLSAIPASMAASASLRAWNEALAYRPDRMSVIAV